MDFDLSQDQVALREAAAALLERHASEDVVRQRVGPGTVVGTMPGTPAPSPATGEGARQTPDAPSGYDAALWSAMAEQGWLGVERPEPEAGLGLGMVEVAVLCEQLGRHVAPAPFLPTVLALQAVADAASPTEPDPAGPSQVASAAGTDPTEPDPALVEWAERLSSGDAVGAVAWSADTAAVTVVEDGGGVRLQGSPDPVLYGPSADLVVLAAGDGLFAVAPAEGYRPVAEPAMDRTRELGWLRLDGAPAWRLGDRTAAERLLDRAVTGTSAELLGAAERALEMSVEYAKDRVQFGKPIGSFQAIKHKLADALVDVEGMRSTVYYAAWCSAAGDPEASLAASMAKAWCSDASRRVMAACLQVHGGIGFTWEHVLHLYLKRSQLDQVSFGDASWHRERIATLLRRRLSEGGSVF